MKTKVRLSDRHTERVSFYSLRIGDLVDVGFGFVRVAEVCVSDEYAAIEYVDGYGTRQRVKFNPSNWRRRVIGGQWPTR